MRRARRRSPPRRWSGPTRCSATSRSAWTRRSRPSRSRLAVPRARGAPCSAPSGPPSRRWASCAGIRGLALAAAAKTKTRSLSNPVVRASSPHLPAPAPCRCDRTPSHHADNLEGCMPLPTRAVSHALVALVLLPAAAAASAQESKSAPLAKQLAAALDAAKMDSIAAPDPRAPDVFVAALYFPGMQLLVVSAKYTAPQLMTERLGKREF